MVRVAASFIGSILVGIAVRSTHVTICRRAATASAAPPTTRLKMVPNASPEFATLATLLREISSLRDVQGILGWDEQVAMQPGSAEARGRQKAALAGVVHEKAVSDELDAAIAACETESVLASLGDYQRAVVRDARRDYFHTARVSKELTSRIAQVESSSVAAWAEARKNNTFDTFAPHLEESVKLARLYATTTRPDMDPYDAGIDLYERGMTAARIEEIFDSVTIPLKALLTKVAKAMETAPPVKEALLGGEAWDVKAQAALCKEVAELMGFDFGKGIIATSNHPFTGGANDDVRITTRYSNDVPFEGIAGVVHEVGHGLYEQGKHRDFIGLPVCEALSMGSHESQSLFWERMISQTPEFWKAVLPIVHKHLPHTRDCTAEDFAYAVNRVNPKGLIRVDADELSYPFHIIMRTQIEKGLFSGSIKVSELPRVWNEKMKDFFDVDVPSDAKGCLQDIHWSGGAFGYFPTYTLGAMVAAQLYSYMDREGLPGMSKRIANGDFAEIKTYLNKNFHEIGSLYPSLDELLVAVAGERLNTKYFMDYLTAKYTALYNL